MNEILTLVSLLICFFGLLIFYDWLSIRNQHED